MGLVFLKRISICVATIFMMMVSSTHAAQSSMKGYELYSWKIKDHWYYSLLPGTNRSKTYEEITAPGVVKKDASGLKAELEKLPKGEEVFWRSDAPPGVIKPASGPLVEIKHPSRARIKGIKAMCDKLGLKLKLV
jgi:hypothetical protein